MNHLFHQHYTQRRLKKITDVLGNGWFEKKSVLELGAAHGDVGVELMKLGANVTFSDVREEHLESIKEKLFFEPQTVIINQNNPYDLHKKFDLVLHLAVLCHIENWKQDLASALNHSNLMFLETAVDPRKGSVDSFNPPSNFMYDGFNCKQPLFTQESVEAVLTSLGCKFIRFDCSELNSTWSWLTKDTMIKQVYDWSYDSLPYYVHKELKSNQTSVGVDYKLHFRRMWLVLK
jgi:hypothetical protein